MDHLREFPDDFRKCVRFHGHVCPGLALGYAAAKAAVAHLNIARSPDEEVVAIVENDSCAVDAIQVMLGCTFGKGNFIFRDWGKQVFTVLERRSGRGVRISLRGEGFPGQEERRALKTKIDSGTASPAEQEMWEELRTRVAKELIDSPADRFFEVKEVHPEMPAMASVVESRPCDRCGEATMTSRLVEKDGELICRGCAAELTRCAT